MKRVIPLLLLLLVAVGCRNRLNSESSMSVNLLDKEFRTVDPISKEQTIKVAATATSGQFNLFVYLEKDKTDAEKAIDANKTSPKILAREEKKEKAEVTATIPANERAVVCIMSGDGKKADVKLRITN